MEKTKLKMVYWKGDRFWVGKLLEHPEIMTQGETLEELEENIKDAKTGKSSPSQGIVR